jgi:hypothetical protein
MAMKNYIFLLLFVFKTAVFFAQNKTNTIKIRKEKWNVSVTSSDSIFWINRENIVTVNVTGGTNYCINVKDAKIQFSKERYIVNVFNEGATTLTVYEKLPNKKLRTLYTKLYEVRHIPDPIAYVCGVKADSVIDKQQIINDNIVTAVHPFYHLQLPVVGFDLVFINGKQINRLTSTNNHFTINMRKLIYYVASGSIIYFENVYCAMPDGTIEKVPDFQIFVTETNKYKVGYQVKGL